MTFAQELRRIRQRSLLTQEEFAKEVNVTISTVNRWERGETAPNLSAMKGIKKFCDTNNVEYNRLVNLWLSYKERL